MSAGHRIFHDESVVRMPRTSAGRCLNSALIRVSYYSDLNYCFLNGFTRRDIAREVRDIYPAIGALFFPDYCCEIQSHGLAYTLKSRGWNCWSRFPFHPISYQLRQKIGKRNYILTHAGLFQSCHVRISLIHWNYSPWITATG